jgi:hypothetical protein
LDSFFHHHGDGLTLSAVLTQRQVRAAARNDDKAQTDTHRYAAHHILQSASIVFPSEMPFFSSHTPSQATSCQSIGDYPF